jgi:hypothetical protein
MNWIPSMPTHMFTTFFKYFNVSYKIVDNDPDIIIYIVFGEWNPNLLDKNHKNPKTIFYTGENRRPDPNADLNLTFDYTKQHNNIRLPLWIYYINKSNNRSGATPDTVKWPDNIYSKLVHHTDFCCFVYSNKVSYRNDFCSQLSKYKKVNCGGSQLNNVGEKIVDKLAFQKKHKFCIAFENSSYPGYTTEKILDVYQSNCLPIYFGNPNITTDFNNGTFINGHDFKNNEDLINYIIKVDQDYNLYKSYFNKPIFSNTWQKRFNDKKFMATFSYKDHKLEKYKEKDIICATCTFSNFLVYKMGFSELTIPNYFCTMIHTGGYTNLDLIPKNEFSNKLKNSRQSWMLNAQGDGICDEYLKCPTIHNIFYSFLENEFPTKTEYEYDRGIKNNKLIKTLLLTCILTILLLISLRLVYNQKRLLPSLFNLSLISDVDIPVFLGII